MEKTVISLDQLTPDNVSRLTEGDVSNILNKLVSDYPKVYRSRYVNILSSAFDFRSVVANNPDLKSRMLKDGYQFFAIPYNNKVVMAIRNKTVH